MKHLTFASTLGMLCLCAQAFGVPLQYEVQMREIISPADDILSPADLDRPEKKAENTAAVSYTGSGRGEVLVGQMLVYYETQKGILRPEKPVPLQRKEAQIGPQLTADIRPTADGLLEAEVSFRTTEWESPPPKNPENPPIDPVLRTRGIAVTLRLKSGETVRLGSLPTIIAGKGGAQGEPGFRTYFLTVTQMPPRPTPPSSQAAPAHSYLEESQARREQFARERNEGEALWYFPSPMAQTPEARTPLQGYQREGEIQTAPAKD